MAPAAPRNPARLRWPGAIGFGLSVLLLWWALHDVGPREMVSQVRQARPLWFLLAVLFATATFPLRTIRWRYLLRRDGAVLPMRLLWHATAIGFMANNLLPARAGEVARAYAARHLTGVRFTSALGSLAVERVLDGLVLVSLLAIGMAWGGLGGGTSVGGVSLARLATLAAVVFVPMLLGAFWLVRWPHHALGLAETITKRILPRAWAAGLLDMLQGVLGGLDALKSPRRFLLVTVWSVVVWVVSAASFWLGFVALGVDVPASAAPVLLGLVAFGVAIPSSPGFFGPFEAVTRATLGLYGVAAPQAVSFAVAYHIGVFVPITVLGLWSLSRAHLHLADVQRAGEGGAAGGAGGAAREQA